MQRHRFDVRSISCTVVLAGGIAALSLVAGFRPWFALALGTATMTVAGWAYLTEP